MYLRIMPLSRFYYPETRCFINAFYYYYYYYIRMKKQGKRSKKKHLSKEAFKKIRYKQKMWRIYKYTGKDKDYEAYKEALNAATNEVRKSKRKFEHKLAQNLKSDSKSFYAYVRSKQNVRDKVGPLEDNAGNIITQ